jgi:hypothetical protein
MNFDNSTESIIPALQPYIIISTNGALGIPAGTTAERPLSPNAGFLRFNTSIQALECWSGSSWGPTTTGAASIVCSENLTAGDFINVWNSAGAAVRKADASVAGKDAHGFVTASFISGASAVVYFEGTNTGVTGQTPGRVFLSTSPGLATSIAPSTTGNVVQCIGVATSATSINFKSNLPVTLA